MEVLPDVVSMGSWLDQLPSGEQQKVRARFRMSPAAYEKMRERVKGPEDLKEEQEWNEEMAQLKFTLETEKPVKDALKEQIISDIENGGIESITEDTNLSPETEKQIEQGQFEITVDSVTEDSNDQLVIVPEGNVGEKIPIRFSLTQSYMSEITSDT